MNQYVGQIDKRGCYILPDTNSFKNACATILEQKPRMGGIGTLGEKALHAVIKQYLEPDGSKHEAKLKSFVVDIYSEDHIYEIQTREFNKLRAKLSALLPCHGITIVYPIPAKKWLLWIDPDSGELSKPRLSPKQGNVYECFYELYKIKPFLLNPNLSVLILLIDMQEYRLLNGWSEDRKRGSRRNDRIPLCLIQELFISGPLDYGKLLPEGLSETFTSADYAKAALVSRGKAQTALNVLSYLNIIMLCGKQGRLNLYTRRQL